MPSFYTVANGNTAQAQDVNQLVNALNGSAGNGVPLAVTAVNDSVNFALVVKNADATNSRSLQVLRANNNVLLQADVNGLIGSPDGGAITAQLVTVSHTQTLTNKTLTNPTINTPTFGAGGASTFNGAVNLAAGVPIEDVSASPTVRVRNLGVVANSATAQLLDVANMQALVIILCVDDGSMALYECRGAQNTTAELLDSQNIYSAVFNTATSMNIYWSAGNARYEIQNLRGANRTFRIVYFATG